MYALESLSLLREWHTGNEVSTLFIKPWILQVYSGFDPSEKPITKHPLALKFEWSNWPSVQKIRAIKGSSDTSLRELAELCIKRQQLLEKRLEEIQKEIDKEVYRIYGISYEDRALIERELAFYQNDEGKDLSLIHI